MFRKLYFFTLLGTCLTIAAQAASPILKTEKTAYDYQENITVEFKDIPAGATILLYKDQGILPLKTAYTIEGDEHYNSGSFNAGNAIEPGRYTVKCITPTGEQKAENIYFTVHGIPATDRDKKIFVMSDIHVMNPSLLVKEGTAFDNTFKSSRKLLKESEEILKTMVDTILNRKPALVLIPGDMTKDGELVSHTLVASHLKKITDKGIKVLVIPGNHDINNPYAAIYNGEKAEYTQTITPGEFAEIYKNCGYDNALSRDAHSLSYTSEPFKNLVVICIDACKYQENKLINHGDESDVFVSGGRIKPETMAWISTQAKAATDRGKQIIAIMHHNLVEHFNMQATLAGPYVVDNAAEVREELIKSGINVVFTGHFHVSDIAKDYNASKNGFIYDIATGATVTYPCPFREVTFNQDNTEMKITSGLLNNLPSADTGEKPFDIYARDQVADGIDPIIRSLAASNWTTINQAIDQFLVQYPIGSLIKRPGTPEELGDLLVDSFDETAQKIYLTFSEGNEHLKLTDGLTDEVKAGVEKLIRKIVLPIGQNIAINMAKEKLYPDLENVINSIIENTTNYNTDNASLSNDQYIAISLPDRQSNLYEYTRHNLIAGEYGTICLPYEAVADNALIYTVSGVDNKAAPRYLYLNKTDKMEAGKPYIFSATAEGDVTFFHKNENPSEAMQSNGLIGTLQETPVKAGENNYVLEPKAGGAEYNWRNITESGYKCGANRAYLNIEYVTETEGTPVTDITIPFASNGGETGVGTITKDEENTPVDVYTTLGIKIRSRVDRASALYNLPEGIYIMGGKKVIVKR